jgi:hypothetical protein
VSSPLFRQAGTFINPPSNPAALSTRFTSISNSVSKALSDASPDSGDARHAAGGRGEGRRHPPPTSTGSSVVNKICHYHQWHQRAIHPSITTSSPGPTAPLGSFDQPILLFQRDNHWLKPKMNHRQRGWDPSRSVGRSSTS